MIRLFAALALPDEIAAGLARRQDGVPGARWRPREALHVTLRFFGEVANDVAADLDAALAELAGEPLELTLAGVGQFGDGDHMRALWAGVEENAALRRLAERIETRARRAGLEPEKRRYRPHVTLAYLKHADPLKVAAWEQANNLLKSPPFAVERFGLYSSWLSQDGSRYDLERDYPLAAPASGARA